MLFADVPTITDGCSCGETSSIRSFPIAFANGSSSCEPIGEEMPLINQFVPLHELERKTSPPIAETKAITKIREGLSMIGKLKLSIYLFAKK
jgi:hypothetical protein